MPTPDDRPLMPNSTPNPPIRFADFELDVAGYELRKAGRAIRMERQPMDLLIMLVERRGQLVSREEIIERLWGKDVFVDVETGVHTAIRKVRRALNDSPEAPAFIETVSGKGYRFIAPVEIAAPPPPIFPTAPSLESKSPGISRRQVIGLAVAALALAAIAWSWLDRATPAGPITIAVLPFEDLGVDPERAYLADGLTEEIITWLGQADPAHVNVVSRTSATLARQRATSLGEIGRALGADYLVETSIRSEGGRARITAKLTRARDQVQVWSQIYNRELTGMLGLQQELGAAIAEQIRFRLTPERSAALLKRAPRVAEAYDEYLRGLTFANQRTLPTTQQAIQHYERATTLDPEYALAWSGLAVTLGAGAINSDVPPLDVIPRVRDAAEKAMAANPNLAESNYARGYVDWMLEWHWPAAETRFRRAIELDPRNAWAHTMLGHLLSQMGRPNEALVETRRARELDPQNAITYALSSQVAFQARDYKAALDHASQAIALDSELWIGQMMRGQAYEQSGQPGLAIEALTIAERFSGGNSKPIALRGYILAKTGKRDEAREVISTLQTRSRERYVPPYAFALVQAGLGDRDAAFEFLNKALEVYDVHLIYLPVDPKWDEFRSDPRFIDLLKRCGF